jgi:hypothetical protein
MRRSAVLELDADKVEEFGVDSAAEPDGDGRRVVNYMELTMTMIMKGRTATHRSLAPRDIPPWYQSCGRKKYTAEYRLHEHELEKVMVIRDAFERSEDGSHENMPRDWKKKVPFVKS